MGRCFGRNRGCNHVFTCATVAHAGGLGSATDQGAYSERSGNQVISACRSRLRNPATSRSVNTSVPVPVRMAGNQIAGLFGLLIMSQRNATDQCRMTHLSA